MTRAAWTKAGGMWFTIHGQFRAEIKVGDPPLRMYRWSVFTPTMHGSMGATSSLPASKRAAKEEMARLKKFLSSTR